MKTCVNISFTSNVRFRKRFTAKHLTMFGFFLIYSQSVRAKKKEREKKKHCRQVKDETSKMPGAFWNFGTFCGSCLRDRRIDQVRVLELGYLPLFNQDNAVTARLVVRLEHSTIPLIRLFGTGYPPHREYGWILCIKMYLTTPYP